MGGGGGGGGGSVRYLYGKIYLTIKVLINPHMLALVLPYCNEQGEVCSQQVLLRECVPLVPGLGRNIR